MPSAFLLINADLGSNDKVVDELQKIPNVKESYRGLRTLRHSGKGRSRIDGQAQGNRNRKD